MTRALCGAPAALAVSLAVSLASCTPLDAGVTVERAFVVRGAGMSPGAFYATVRNARATPDTLLGVVIDSADVVTLHENVRDAAGNALMREVASIAVPSRGEMRLAPGGAHGMVGGLRAGVARGDSLALTLRFSRQGSRSARAAVIDYDQVDRSVGRGGR